MNETFEERVAEKALTRQSVAKQVKEVLDRYTEKCSADCTSYSSEEVYEILMKYGVGLGAEDTISEEDKALGILTKAIEKGRQKEFYQNREVEFMYGGRKFAVRELAQ